MFSVGGRLEISPVPVMTKLRFISKIKYQFSDERFRMVNVVKRPLFVNAD